MLIKKVKNITKLSRDKPKENIHKSEISFEEVLQKEIKKIKRKGA